MVSTMLSARTARTMHKEWPDWVATIRAIAEGDQRALGELFDATSPLVLGLIRRIVQDIPTAEEITLDVYTQVWRLAGTYAQRQRHANHLAAHARAQPGHRSSAFSR